MKWTNWPAQPLAGHLLDVDLRMAEQQAQQFAAGVAGGADDGNRESIASSMLGYADAPSAASGILRCGSGSPLGQPLAAAQPSFATFSAKSTTMAGMLTPVGAMLLRNSIV